MNVTGTSAGSKSNTTGTISSTETGAGATSNTATLTLVAPPTISKAFSPTSVALNGTSTLTFTLGNPNTGTALTGVAFNDNLPSGLVVNSPNGAVNNCGGSLTAAAASGSISSSGVTIAASGSCTISVDVKGTTVGSKSNTTDAITSTNGGTGTTSNTATLNVASPPTISKAFSPTSIAVGGTSTVTFTITNPNSGLALTGVAFSDTLVSGLVVATPNGASNTCNGTLSATAGSSSISLSGGTLASNGSCSISVNVTGTSAGSKSNTTGAISATETGTGATSNTATLTVVAPPTISKAFGAASIPLNGTTSLTLTISNPNTGTALSGVAVTDNFPSGLQVATTPNASNSCGGTLTGATSGSSSISLSGGTVSASSSCAISLNVTATTSGTKVNTTTAVTSSNGGTGNMGSASLNSSDFTISVSPTSQTISPGQMAVYTLTLSSTTGFTGTIGLTCSGGPPNSTCTIVPSSVTLSGSSETTKATIHLNAPKGASKGTFTLTFTGTSGTLTHSTTATLRVK